MNASKGLLKIAQLIVFAFLFTICTFLADAQTGYTISGKIISAETGEVLSFANVALLDSTATYPEGGAASNDEGIFILPPMVSGTYYLRISILGFETHLRRVDLNYEDLFAGKIELQGADKQLEVVEVVGERIKAKQVSDRTTFFVNKKMQNASTTGTDILKILPGVRIDLQQNISLEGSSNILILVDGKERDRNFLSQLPASRIDKVEIISSPPAKYDSWVTGVINVVLIREDNRGADGHFNLEIPTSDSEIFLAPVYNLNYGFGKFNLMTSYNGDIRYFNIREIYHREIAGNTGLTEITSCRVLRQKTWSHRFHYGFDWFVNERNQLNFYGYYNPFSQELDGSVKVHTVGSGQKNWLAEKDDVDINRGGFYSIWYKHLFGNAPGHEITLDVSLFNLKAENITRFSYPESGFFYENKIMPQNRLVNFKADYMNPAGEKLKIGGGVHARLRYLRDRNLMEFQYDEEIVSGYGTFSYRTSRMETVLGMRLENRMNRVLQERDNRNLFFLPGVTVLFNLNGSQNLKITYRRSVSYSGFYQLNTFSFMEDPYTRYSGNSDLQPEKDNKLNFDYSRRIESHFVSAGLFYRRTSDAVRSLMSHEDGVFMIQKNNMGEISQCGIHISGALGFPKAGLQPYIRVYDVHSLPNLLATGYQIVKQHKLVFESGFSAFVTFRKDLTATAIIHYTSPMHEIQETSFSGALYFISLEKSFSKGLKAGVVSGVPLSQNFTFQGSKVSSGQFSHYSKGEIAMSTLPLWIKISYRFTSNNNRKKLDRSGVVPEYEVRKGF